MVFSKEASIKVVVSRTKQIFSSNLSNKFLFSSKHLSSQVSRTSTSRPPWQQRRRQFRQWQQRHRDPDLQ